MDEDLKATISVIDHATAPIRGIAGAFAKLSQPISAVGGAMGRVWNASGMGRVASAVGGVGRSVAGLGGQLSGLLGPLAAIGGVGSMAWLTAAARGFTATAAAAGGAAAKLGMTVEAYQEVAFAAKAKHVPVDQFNMSMGRLNREIAEAAGGSNKSLRELFGKLGISMRDANGHFQTSEDLLPQLADAFAKNSNPAIRAAMAQALLGKAGMAMIPLLTKGSAGLGCLVPGFDGLDRT